MDAAAVLALGHLKIMFDEVRNEIWRRLESLEVGKQVVLWLDRIPGLMWEDFLKTIEPPRFIRVGKQIIQRDNVSKEENSEFRKLDEQGFNIEALANICKGLREKVESESWTDYPFSPVAKIYSNASPVWNKVFPQIMREQIQAHHKELLLILQGDLENARLLIFNKYRTTFRQEVAWEVLKGEREQTKPASKVHHAEQERERLDPRIYSDIDRSIDASRAAKVFSERLKAKLKRAPIRKRSALLKAIYLYLETGSIRESAMESNLDEDTVRKYVIELNLAPIKPVRTRRKS